MRVPIFFSLLLILSASITLFPQQRPQISYVDLIINAERDFNVITEARELAEKLNLPHTIYLPEGIFIEAKGVESGKVIYSVVKDLLHPLQNGEVVFWEEIAGRYDLSRARVHWSDRPVQNPELGYLKTPQQMMPAAKYVMVLESTNDAVMIFNYADGSLINSAFVPGGNANLSTPIEAQLTDSLKLIISDQITDKLVEFDTLGAFQRVLYGPNTAILDNCRGIELRPGTNTVLVAIAGGTNQDVIGEFDLSTGNYIGNFIPANTTQMNGPWDIIFRTNDCLVSGEASDNLVKYTLDGTYISSFGPSLDFPEQITETSRGNILVAVFSNPSGLTVLDSGGTILNTFTSVTSLRGAIELGNGNYMITNAAGVHIIDPATGALISTPVSGVGGRSASYFKPASASATFQFNVTVAGGWNMVGIPGLLPGAQTPDAWWSQRDQGANLFKFQGGYQPVTGELEPGVGYWMKHIGSNTYNTGDEYPAGGINIAPHTPIPGAMGWILISVYECPVPAASITTTPPGLITGSIYGYTPGSGYQAVNTLYPGFAYWVKLTAAGTVNLPPCP